MEMDHTHHHMHEHAEPKARDYIIFAGIILFVALASWVITRLVGYTWQNYLRFFMGMFFLTFAFFKLLDLSGFVMSYIGYDIIAKRFTQYAYTYPFIELTLALGYFVNTPSIDWITLFFMAIGSIGVFQQLMRKSKIKCACLGTYVNLPLTTVSLIEDVAMGLMALVLIIYK